MLDEDMSVYTIHLSDRHVPSNIRSTHSIFVSVSVAAYWYIYIYYYFFQYIAFQYKLPHALIQFGLGTKRTCLGGKDGEILS